MAIILPRKSLPYPPGSYIQVDQSHPLARGLVRLWPFSLYAGGGLSPYGLAEGDRLVPTTLGSANLAWNSSPDGYMLTANNTTGQKLNTDAGIPALTQYTFLTRFVRTVLGWSEMQFLSTPTDNVGMSYGYDTGVPWDFPMFWDGGTLNGTTVFTLGKTYQVAFTSGNGSKDIWVDAKVDATSTPTNSISAGTCSLFNHVDEITNPRALNGGMLEASLYNRPLSRNELDWLRVEPYAFFLPDGRHRTYSYGLKEIVIQMG